MFRRGGIALKFRRTVAIVWLAAFGLLPHDLACERKGGRMVPNGESGISSRLTQEDGLAIKDGLLKAISRSEDSSLERLVPEIESATPFIDSDGTLYLKKWRFDRNKGRIIRRPTGSSEGPVFEADVSKQNNKWVVGDITVGRMVRPR